MRRLIMLLLLAVLLTGCGVQTTMEPETEASTAETEAPGMYDPDSDVEKQTGGAVRAYPLGKSGYTWLAFMEENLLLGAGDPVTTLTVLTGENCVPGAKAMLPADAWDIHVTELGVSYYDKSDNAVVYLNKSMLERYRVPLPEDAQGIPIVGESSEEIFYCTADELLGLSPETGISRLIKQVDCLRQSLEREYFGGKILACRVTDRTGREKLHYIDTQTGQTLYSTDTLLPLDTYQDRYLLTRMDGVVEQKIFGTLAEPLGQLELESAIPTLPLNGVLTCEAGETLRLSFYSLNTGTKTAAVELDGISEPVAYLADAANQYIWLLTYERNTGREVLCRWELKKSPVQDDSVYTHALVTSQQPDEEALNLCAAKAEALNQMHGIDIRIWQDAVGEPGEYALTPEYQASAIDAMLDGVEAAALWFPVDFLEESADGKLHICLVRQIGQQESAVQYWLDGEPYIVLPSGCDAEQELLERIGYVIDTHVLGNSPVYDYWNQLNPAGFTYDLDYAVSEARPDGQYLEGAERAFIDKRSMSFPTEDRCRIFAYAMRLDCGDFFTSDTMQAKLVLMCRGIRQAYGLRKDPREFPWEQYLEKSLAYQNNRI